MLYIALDISSNVLGYKIVDFGIVKETGSAFIFPLTYVIDDIVTEVYGFRIAKLIAVWFSVIIGIFTTALITLVVYLPAAQNWGHQTEFVDVLGNTWRFVLGGYTAKIFGSYINIYILSKLKKLMRGRLFFIRSIISSAVGEAVYLAIAGTIIFYGIMPAFDIVIILFFNYLAKITVNIVFSYPAQVVSRILIKRENFSKYDQSNENSPFRAT